MVSFLNQVKIKKLHLQSFNLKSSFLWTFIMIALSIEGLQITILCTTPFNCREGRRGEVVRIPLPHPLYFFIPFPMKENPKSINNFSVDKDSAISINAKRRLGLLKIIKRFSIFLWLWNIGIMTMKLLRGL